MMADSESPASPCVGSGFCCKKVPCPYGERDRSTGWCVHLEPWKGDDLDVPRYRCGRYEYIKTQPGWQFMPAFGAGCSSTLFNTDRTRVLVALRIKTLKKSSPEGDELRWLVELSKADDDAFDEIELALAQQLLAKPA